MKKLFLIIYCGILSGFLFSAEFECHYDNMQGEINFKNNNIKVTFYDKNVDNVYYFLRFANKAMQLEKIYKKYFPQGRKNKFFCGMYMVPILIIESKRENEPRMRHFQNEIPITMKAGKFKTICFIMEIHEDVERTLINPPKQNWEGNARWFREGFANFCAYYFTEKIIENDLNDVPKNLKDNYKTLNKVYKEIDLKNFISEKVDVNLSCPPFDMRQTLVYNKGVNVMERSVMEFTPLQTKNGGKICQGKVN